MTLPELFIERLAHIIPPTAWDAVYQSFITPRSIGIRVNTLKTTSLAMEARWQDL